MKKLFLALLAVSVLGFSSCSDDDDPQPTPNPEVKFDVENFKGEIMDGEAITLDASKTYMLSGALIVKKGGSLTIPAGTRIVASATSASDVDVRYIAVEQGAKIYIKGTASAPVVMTSEVKEAEAWGGLVVCGYAPTNKADAGSAGAEVSGLAYGGDQPNDSSGSIEYLRLEYTGYKYTNEKEFNGLSMFGVGSGTVVDYVVSYKGGDDGMEFFGGTVNASHLVSVDSGDDGIDFADGWSGIGEYWFSLNSAKSGIEGSNNGDNGAATPMTDATLRNITAYAMGEKPFFLKEGAGMMNIDNIVIGGLKAEKTQAIFYASSDDADAAARINAGDVVVSNANFVDMKEGQTKAVSILTVGENIEAKGAGNGINKPDWVSDALNTVDANTTVFGDAVVARVAFKGDITSDMTLDANTIYMLNGAVVVKEGASLTIPAGTVIIASEVSANDTDVRYIAVEQGAKIFVNGTADAPVVMTCEKTEAEAWGGLVVCGKAPTNKADAGSAGAEVSGLSYGGDVADDNSGKISYLRLEYTGYKYTNEKEFNGLSLFGVGSGTTVEYVVSYKGGDDGMEFFGGTVDASYLLSFESGDDGIDFADGWSGTGMNWMSINSAKSGIEGSNNGDNGAATPMTHATLKNLSVFGMGEKPFYLKEGAGKMNIDNIVIGGLADNKGQAYFYVSSSDTDAADRIAADDIVITNVKFDQMGAGNTEKAAAGLSFTENANATGAGNGFGKPSWLSDALNKAYNGEVIVN
ncbi:hypothetical protein EV201_2907 [Ancylomarina subtilis]|uniref:Uncharacterized protein n=1 Tax=Ancylomarina subtilis TaxID=1639035 RepID=A0A4Q7V724_9BACT|nr:hypothetical protein [Ancylomarina subtilis]RZT92431.1 hypothetical protein EV201_2907 [Ancylomarina subtilis]